MEEALPGTEAAGQRPLHSSTLIANLLPENPHGGRWLVARMVLTGGAAKPDADAPMLLIATLAAMAENDATATFLLCPARFVSVSSPFDLEGRGGWYEDPYAFEALRHFVEEAAAGLLPSAVTSAARGVTDFLVFGVDVLSQSESSEPHAEFACVYDVISGAIVAVVGTSYPTVDQERDLIRDPATGAHVVRLGNERVALLVCHDLAVWSPRGRRTRQGRREFVANEIAATVGAAVPTVALHLPRTLYSPQTWGSSWRVFRAEYPSSLLVWASAIRYSTKGGWPPRGGITRLLRRTSGPEEQVLDVILAGRSRGPRPTAGRGGR